MDYFAIRVYLSSETRRSMGLDYSLGVSVPGGIRDTWTIDLSTDLDLEKSLMMWRQSMCHLTWIFLLLWWFGAIHQVSSVEDHQLDASRG